MKKFDFLDTFRGILTLSVIFTHTNTGVFVLHGFYLGVIGFFLLSSFLLTYRLLVQYEKAVTYHEIFKITINYFITRLFRIYVPFISFLLMLRVLVYFTNIQKQQKPIWTFMILEKTGGHLWTMPIEIRFYFMVPIIAFASSRIGHKLNFCIAVLLMVIIGTMDHHGYLIEKDQVELRPKKFIDNLPIFLNGSFLAYVYKTLDKTRWFDGSLVGKQKILRQSTTVIFYTLFLAGAR